MATALDDEPELLVVPAPLVESVLLTVAAPLELEVATVTLPAAPLVLRAALDDDDVAPELPPELADAADETELVGVPEELGRPVEARPVELDEEEADEATVSERGIVVAAPELEVLTAAVPGDPGVVPHAARRMPSAANRARGRRASPMFCSLSARPQSRSPPSAWPRLAATRPRDCLGQAHPPASDVEHRPLGDWDLGLGEPARSSGAPPDRRDRNVSVASLPAIPLVILLVYGVLRHLNNPCHADGPHVQVGRGGRQRSAWICLNGKREGPMTQWNDDGGVEIEGHFVGGERDGEWLIYDDKGQVIQRQPWSRGSQVQKRQDEAP